MFIEGTQVNFGEWMPLNNAHSSFNFFEDHKQIFFSYYSHSTMFTKESCISTYFGGVIDFRGNGQMRK